MFTKPRALIAFGSDDANETQKLLENFITVPANFGMPETL